MNREHLVSIIVPVYNVEHYLCECLDSILKQSYNNWEAILIDDGSKDASGAICDEYARKDTRFRVMHKKNEGVSSARNQGLDSANGEWICFVDSDDKLSPDALSSMLMCVLENGSDVCLCPVFKEHIKYDRSVHLLDQRGKEELILACLAYKTEKYVEHGFMVDAPHAKLFNHSLIKSHNIHFIEGLSKSEDAIFDAYFYHYSQSISLLDHPVYYYTINANSISHTFSDNIVGMLVSVLCEEESFVNMHYEENSLFYDAIYVRAFVGIQQLLHEAGAKSLSIFRQISLVNKYLKADIVHKLLHNLTNESIHNHFTSDKTIDLYLAQHKLSLLLVLWAVFFERYVAVKVSVVTLIKRLLGMNQKDSIRVLISNKNSL